MSKTILNKDEIKRGLDMLSMNPYRITEVTTEAVREENEPFLLVTFKVVLDDVMSPEPAIGNS